MISERGEYLRSGDAATDTDIQTGPGGCPTALPDFNVSTTASDQVMGVRPRCMTARVNADAPPSISGHMKNDRMIRIHNIYHIRFPWLDCVHLC